jgi:hypothetical protein
MSKSVIIWVVTPYSPVEAKQYFGETNRLHLQGQGINRSKTSISRALLAAHPEDGGDSFTDHSGLTRGGVCLLYMLLVLASAVFLGSESLRTRDHILLSQI